MVQIFVKVNGSKATPIEVNLTDDRVEDIMRQVQNDEDAYVTMQGKLLKTSEKLKSCGVTDGCTIQVTSRMRGGGKHKDKMSKGEKKQVAQLDDGMCAMACEQMRWITESVSTLQSTDEEKRRLAEEVEKVRKAMAGMGKKATGGDLQRVAEMEESLKKLKEEVQAKDVDEQEMMMDFEGKGEKKVVREGRGSAGLVQGGDETHRMNETCGKSKGKGNGGKGEHGGKGDKGGKGFQQSMKTMKGEEEQKADEEDERDRVAPNMGAGGSHPQATTDPEEEAVEEERGTRKLRWADCYDKEEEEGWKRKAMWLDGSDEEQGGQEEAAEERSERCEVWKERLSGRVEVSSEENQEPEERRKTTDEKPPGLEDVESELKAQEEKSEGLSQVENEQEVREDEERRAHEAREDEERRAHEAREDEERRAQEALRRSELSKRKEKSRPRGRHESDVKPRRGMKVRRRPKVGKKKKMRIQCMRSATCRTDT